MYLRGRRAVLRELRQAGVASDHLDRKVDRLMDKISFPFQASPGDSIDSGSKRRLKALACYQVVHKRRQKLCKLKAKNKAEDGLEV